MTYWHPEDDPEEFERRREQLNQELEQQEAGRICPDLERELASLRRQGAVVDSQVQGEPE